MTKPSHDPAAANKEPAPEAPKSEEARLDEALDETFPASDPIAVHPEREDKPAER